MPSRYLMIAGFAVLGILFYDKLDLTVAGKIDYEQVLPSAINQFVPTGLLGLLLAGLLAAFMSTFAGTLNAAQAYITNDLYLKYMNKNPNQKQVKSSNYLSGIIIVIISIIIGMASKNVNQLLQIIVSALWGGYVASNVIKWYWWRFQFLRLLLWYAIWDGLQCSLIDLARESLKTSIRISHLISVSSISSPSSSHSPL